MDEILALRKKLSDNDFEIRSLENSVKENIELIKTEVTNWVNMGIITEEQAKFISNLSLDKIKNGDLSEFKTVFEGLKEIVNKFNTNIASLEQQLKEIESM